jgi:ABC-type antimicrobial peptide transport system permease subunit
VRQPHNIDRQIVGLVRDAVDDTVRGPVPPTLYMAYEQDADPSSSVSLSIRAAGGSPAVLAGAVAAALVRVNPELVISSRPLSERVGAMLVRERVMAMLSVFFGVLALLLAGLGLYGVTMHAVSRRRSEMGVRLALGASPASVARLVLRRVALLVGAGAIVGAMVSVWAVRLVAPLLYVAGARGTASTQDPATLLTATLVLGAIGLLAGWIPARRAARIDAARVLREG